MAFDKSHHEFHLTPDGWVDGLCYYMEARPAKPPPIPENRVETWVREMTQRSGWSRELVNWRCTWTSPELDDDARRALRRRFEKPEIDFPD